MRLRHRFGSSLSRGFNPRICKRCDCSTCVFWASVRRFNPRICKRCDRLADTLYLCGLVSIHASVKDATHLQKSRFIRYWSGFNPRICKRCDFGYRALLSLKFCFNPRICKRCDLSKFAVRDHVSVSIHASVKDATLAIIRFCSMASFNPRICKRCDYTDEFCDPFKRVSIHASVKDATSLRNFIMFRSFVSIHASVKDATVGTQGKAPYPCFNPRICKRCDSMFVKSFIDDTFKL